MTPSTLIIVVVSIGMLAGCECKSGTASFEGAKLLRDSSGKAYVVRRHAGCNFTVLEIEEK